MCSFGSTPAYNPVYNCNRVKTFLCALQSTFLLWWFPQTMDQLVHHHSKDRGSSGTSVLEPNMPVPSQGKAVLKLKLQQWLKVVKCAPNGWGNVQFKNRTIWVWNFCANLPPCQVYTLPQYISNLLMVSIHLCFQQSIYFFKSWSCKPRICQLLEIYLRSPKKIETYLSIFPKWPCNFLFRKEFQKNSKDNLSSYHLFSHFSLEGRINLIPSPDC